MRAKGIFAAACFALTASATPILAADVDIPPEPIIDWTGFHIGAGVGGNFMFADVDAFADIFLDFDDADVDSDEISAFGENESDLGKAGLFGTVEAGFDFQMSRNLVVGILANYDFGEKIKASSETFGSLEAQINDGIIITDVFGSSEFDTKVTMDDSWAVGARLGLLSSESTLLYVLGGYTRAKFGGALFLEGEACVDVDCVDVFLSDSNKKWRSGFFVGGGIETMLTENLSLKGEYRYANYKSLSFASDFTDDDPLVNGVEDPNAFFSAESAFRADPVVHSVRAVLSWHFNPF
jgi:outer membrane immunogenic protein